MKGLFTQEILRIASGRLKFTQVGQVGLLAECTLGIWSPCARIVRGGEGFPRLYMVEVQYGSKSHTGCFRMYEGKK